MENICTKFKQSLSKGCTKCEKTFESLQSLSRHRRESHFNIRFNTDFHEGFKSLKNYKCEVCDMTFKRAEHLKRHMSNVHGETEIFKCTSCEKTFGRKDNMKRHMKKMH